MLPENGQAAAPQAPEGQAKGEESTQPAAPASEPIRDPEAKLQAEAEKASRFGKQRDEARAELEREREEKATLESRLAKLEEERERERSFSRQSAARAALIAQGFPEDSPLTNALVTSLLMQVGDDGKRVTKTTFAAAAAEIGKDYKPAAQPERVIEYRTKIIPSQNAAPLVAENDAPKGPLDHRSHAAVIAARMHQRDAAKATGER